MQKNIILVLSAVILVFIGLAYWLVDIDHDHDHHHDEEEEPQELVVLTEEQIHSHGIGIQEARGGTLQKIVRAPAKITIHADYLAHVYPKVTGNAAVAYKSLGEQVSRDDVLALLESREIAEVKAAYLAALKKEHLTSYRYERERNLNEKKISAEDDFHHAHHDWDEARIDLELNKQKLHALGLTAVEIAALPTADPASLRFYEIRSPISGNIISRHFNSGEFIDLDHEAFEIANLDKVWAEISVLPDDLQYLQEGTQIALHLPNGKQTLADIIFIKPIIDEETRTALVVAEINNESRQWYPGTYLTAIFATQLVDLPLVIPKEAVQKIDDIDTVFVVSPEGFRSRPVKLGLSDEKNVEVIAGLEPGEMYASKNTFLLKADLKKAEAEHMD